MTKPRGQTACGPQASLRCGHMLFHSPAPICSHPPLWPSTNVGQCSPAHKYAGQNHLRGSLAFHNQVSSRGNRVQLCTTHRSYPQVCTQGRAGLCTDLTEGKRVTLGSQIPRGTYQRSRGLAHERQPMVDVDQRRANHRSVTEPVKPSGECSVRTPSLNPTSGCGDPKTIVPATGRNDRSLRSDHCRRCGMGRPVHRTQPSSTRPES